MLRARQRLLAPPPGGPRSVAAAASDNSFWQEPRGWCDNGEADKAEAYLEGLGIDRRQVERLERQCPEMFRRPVEERAAVLFGQLMGLGLSAAEAARCFEAEPPAIARPSFEPAIGGLADLLASGSRDGQAGLQLLGALLRKQPAVTRLLEYTDAYLQREIDDLLALGLTRIQLAAALRTVPQLLAVGVSSATPRLEKMLQQELGCDRELFLKVLLHLPRMGWQAYEMQLEVVWMKRAQALAEVRGGARISPRSIVQQVWHCIALHCTCVPPAEYVCASLFGAP